MKPHSEKPTDPAALSRRDVLRIGASSGAAVTVAALLPSALPAAGQAPQTAPAALPPFELEEATVVELQAAMQAGRYTAQSLAEAYLGRIAALDGHLRSVIETNPEALAIAEALDAERKAKGPRGPLHGIPVLIKDNIATGDRMETTAGSLALVGAKPARDATVAARLREAGAVILGKTNLSEWANFRSGKSSSGWSGRGGQCRNPYALDRSPCGSSSGSGAAIAANFAAIGVGTETDGSVVCPSATCGIVGIKPTLGLVSRAGIVPIAHSQDTAGPMCRTVADAAALLSALAGADPRDPATAAAAGKAADFTRFLDPNGLKGARLGVPRKRLFGYSTQADELAVQAIADLKRLGAVIVDPADIPHYGEYDAAEFDVLLWEFKADLEAYLGSLPRGPYPRTLKDLIDFNEKHKAEELPYFGQEIFLASAKKGPLTDRAYRKALDRCRQLSRVQGLDHVFEKYQLDALVAPTGGPAWTIDPVNADHYLGSASTPAAVSGYPHVTVPCGYTFGLPVGLSFFGLAWSEPTLIKLAFAYEQATKHRRPARLLPTADLAPR
jgi:amidase